MDQNRLRAIANKLANLGPLQLLEICSDPRIDTELEFCQNVRDMAQACLSGEPIMAEGFIDRLKSEAGELSTKLQTLEHFIERGMPGVTEAHKVLLEAQAAAMKTYQKLLHIRIADLVRDVASECKHETSVSVGEPVEIGGHDEDRDGPVPFGG